MAPILDRQWTSWFAFSVLLAFAGVAAPAMAGEPVARFHTKLAELEAGRGDLVTVLQIGDSHTASDHISGRLRSLLQDRFGNGGRGFLPPGVPHAYYRPYQITVTQTAGWQLLTSNKSAPDAVAFGITGSVMRGSKPEDVIVIEDRSGAGIATLRFGWRGRPDGGSLEVHAEGGLRSRLSMMGPADLPYRTSNNSLDPPARRIELRPTGDGPVDLSSITVYSRDRGVVVANLGSPGAQIGIMGRWHAETVRAELKALDPALIIVAFGTNEGFAPAERIASGYAAEFERRIVALRAAAPDADLVIVGPPDANRFPRYCLPPAPPIAALQKRAATAPTPPQRLLVRLSVRIGAIASAWPPQEPPPATPCTPLSASERARYDQMLGAQDRALCRWHTPAAIPLVREAQASVAARLGVAFFDWGTLFGGECGADAWTRKGLAHKDRVHLKQEGYAQTADRLHELIMTGYPAPGAAPLPLPQSKPGR